MIKLFYNILLICIIEWKHNEMRNEKLTHTLGEVRCNYVHTNYICVNLYMYLIIYLVLKSAIYLTIVPSNFEKFINQD